MSFLLFHRELKGLMPPLSFLTKMYSDKILSIPKHQSIKILKTLVNSTGQTDDELLVALKGEAGISSDWVQLGNILLEHSKVNATKKGKACAYTLFRLASMEGNMDGSFKVAKVLSQTSTGVVESLKILTDLAEKEHPPSMHSIGVHWIKKKQYRRGFQFVSKAADKEFAPAQIYVGLLHLNGLYTKKDTDKAFYFISRAHEQGEIEATQQLSQLYSLGLGCDIDPKKVMELTEMAASKGLLYLIVAHPIAQHNLGDLYFTDDKNIPFALEYWKMASEQKVTRSQTTLGLLYENGYKDLIQKDLKAARFYYQSALNDQDRAAEQYQEDVNNSRRGLRRLDAKKL